MLCDVCDVNKSYEKQHLSSRLTAAAVIVHQYDLFKEVAGGFVYGRLDGAQDDGQRLVHEDEHDADLRQLRGVRRVLAPARRERRAFKQKNHRVSLPPVFKEPARNTSPVTFARAGANRNASDSLAPR